MNDENQPETSQEATEKPTENNDLSVKPSVEPQEVVSETEEISSKKPTENYTYRGGTAFVGFTQALKLTGTSRATLHRYTQNGKLSYETDEDGHKIYQVIELERVFGKLKSPETEEAVSNEGQRNQLETADQDHETTLKVAQLEAEKHQLEIQLAAEREKSRLLEQIADREKEEAEKWHRQAERLSLMLPAPATTTAPEPTPEPEKSKGFLRRIFGG
jgi:DNA-binding transcriptional MerR regulator